ncbi:GMC oxidoreductase [Streptomyces sp. NPDC002172]
MHTRSADPATRPSLDYGHLSAVEDRRRMREAVRAAAELVGTTDFAEVSGGLTDPPAEVLNDDRLLDQWVLGHLGTSHHAWHRPPGPRRRSRAAVDAFGRVQGVDALRVADTSILPTPPLRGPAATAVLFGELVADTMRRGLT